MRHFDLAKFLSDCEVPDSLQAWGVGEDGYVGKDADVAAMVERRKVKSDVELAAGSLQVEQTDYWEVLSPYAGSIGGRDGDVTFLVRHHVVPRETLFSPTSEDLPASILPEQLGNGRETMLQFVGSKSFGAGSKLSGDQRQLRQLAEGVLEHNGIDLDAEDYWVRVDPKARCYLTTRRGGPDWSTVTNRLTFRLEDWD